MGYGEILHQNCTTVIYIRCTHHPFSKGFRSKYYEILATLTQVYLRRFEDPIWVPRISNRVPRKLSSGP